MIIRFFLIAFALLLSNISHADTYVHSESGIKGSTFNIVCTQVVAWINQNEQSTRNVVATNSEPTCTYKHSNDANWGTGTIPIYKIPDEEECYKDPPGPLYILWYEKYGPVPTTVCVPHDGGFCRSTCSIETAVNYPSRSNVNCRYSSRTPVSSCYPTWDNACNPEDPYGGCYTPPNDGCVRQKNGSIICPDDTPPPNPDPKCEFFTQILAPL